MQLLPYTPQTKDLPMPLTDVDQSGFDWHKHPHTKILLSARIRALKPAHKGMLWMLMEHAALEVPFASLPSDAERLAEMAGVALPVWSKAADAVLGAAFVLCSDNRWYCQLLTDALPQHKPQEANEKPKAEGSTSKDRVRRYREKQRNAQNNADVTPSVTPVTPDVTHVTPACNADVTLDTVTSVTFGGIKGGDLDQDLDLENNKHTQSACEDFAPDLAGLNAKLKLAGAEPITQEQLNQTLVTFIPHYETHHLTDNQRMSKLVQWIKGDQTKASPRPIKPRQTAQQPTYGNVNDNWGNPPPPDLDAPVELTEEYKRAMAKLRVKS